MYGEGQKGFFDLPVGDSVTLKMGYRVYEDAFSTKARIHNDYENVNFQLLGSLESSASFLSVGMALVAISSSLAL